MIIFVLFGGGMEWFTAATFPRESIILLFWAISFAIIIPQGKLSNLPADYMCEFMVHV